MGLYVGLRVKGVVKKEFRDEIKKIEEYGEWKKSKDIKFKEFSKIERANFIPNGAYADCESYSKYNKDTGEWDFKCYINYGLETINAFIKLIPYFMEKIEILKSGFTGDVDNVVDEYNMIDGRICLSKSYEERENFEGNI